LQRRAAGRDRGGRSINGVADDVDLLQGLDQTSLGGLVVVVVADVLVAEELAAPGHALLVRIASCQFKR